MSIKLKKGTKLAEWQQKALQEGTCSRCGKHMGQLTVDHIIPLALLDMLDTTGLLRYNWEENFEMVCYPCNKFKAARLDLANQKTIPLLKELVNKL